MGIQRCEIIILDDDKERWIDGFKSRLHQMIPNASIEVFRHVTEFLKLEPHSIDPDVLLLDVLDMDLRPAIAIPAIHQQWPRLPILILSKNTDLVPALEYLRLGARGYLIKSLLSHDGVPAFFGDNLLAGSEQWKDAADLIELAITEYGPIKHLIHDTRIIGSFRKRRGGQQSPLAQQMDFLIRVQRINDPAIRSLFPENVTKTAEDEYVMPYYRAPTLRQRLFDTPTEDALVDTAKVALRAVVPTLKKKLFDSNPVTRSSAGAFVERFYSGRLANRHLESLAKIELLKSRADRDALGGLFKAEQITVDDTTYSSPRLMLDWILSDESRRNLLVPEKEGWIHGDLHFDNILVDTTVAERPFIKLIDPRGFLDGADFAYDIGKLLHSCHGKYDMVDSGYFALGELRLDDWDDETNAVVTKGPRVVEWLTRQVQGGSQDSGESHVRLVTPLHYAAYDKIEAWLVDDLLPNLLDGDNTWRERAYLHEALHFCTMGPFHIARSPAKAAALYIVGIQLLHGFAIRYGFKGKTA